MNAREQMIAGLPFDTHDEALAQERAHAVRLLQKLNTITMEDEQYRPLLNQLLPNASAHCLIRPPFSVITDTTCISVRVVSSITTASCWMEHRSELATMF